MSNDYTVQVLNGRYSAAVTVKAGKPYTAAQRALLSLRIPKGQAATIRIVNLGPHVHLFDLPGMTQGNADGTRKQFSKCRCGKGGPQIA